MGALDGLRVVEAGLLVQGPQAAAMLHDWGAEVIKVELPGFGDQSRWLPVAQGDTRSAYFTACNRGKRSVTLDMRSPAGRDAFLRIADTADVVITNFKPGTMEAWGLGYEDVSARNPSVVYATGSSFGPVGPDATREGADLSGQAAGGIISTIGRADGDPSPIGATIADHIACQNMVGGILAALLARTRTGRGQRVDVSLLGGQIWAQASEYTAFLMTGSVAGPSNGGHPLIPGLYGIFKTADGWIAVVGIVGSVREEFYRLVGRPDLAEQFPQPLYSEQDKARLFPLLDEAFCERTTSEWCQRLAAAGMRHAPVRDHSQVVADPGVWENGYLVRAEGSQGESIVPGSPVRFSETPARAVAETPELGQHTEEVLLEVGYTWEQISELSDAGVT
ncbi:MAG TPA: CaiB/BaiF CoA-transferase family protein [Acidimicrobiales bacterium]|nr:CaiB/BaiF CoA-transferase family protein [Acidimicrobiales bacterium]